MKTCSEKNSLVTMILDLLAVGTVLDIAAVKFADRHDRGHCQRYSFVGRTEQHIKIQPVFIINGSRVVLTEFDEL